MFKVNLSEKTFNMARELELLRIPEDNYLSAEKLDRMEPVVMSMLETFEDVPGFFWLKKLIIRPFFVNSKETAVTIDKIFRASNTGLPRECSEIRIFNVIRCQMTPDERERLETPLADMFHSFAARHVRHLMDTACPHCWSQAERVAMFYVPPLWRKLLQAKRPETSREIIQLLAYQHQAMMIQYRGLERNQGFENELRGLKDPSELEYVLACFSSERFHAFGIREDSDYLMWSMMTVSYDVDRIDRLNAILIRHGFKYSFHKEYYEYCFRLTCSVFPILGELGAPQNLRMQIGELGAPQNLRMQMAVEIMMHLICEHKRNRELLCMLWQSRPDPFITPDELHYLMEPYFFLGSHLANACAKYLELFPWVSEVKQPRSLKHLARVRIRESMVRAHSIGEKTVRSLGLPKTFEDYLWKLEAF